MCGICGIAGFTDNRIVSLMRDKLVHRGPDDRGIFNDIGVSLGHTRLSIIDLSEAGHQPMANEDGTIWITFNGEIYNFPDLRKDLENSGHVFKSNTDTEVIIHLYEQYQEKCVDFLRGMFAFVIWDKKNNRLFAARDRFGIKPFFYTISKSRFIFASELNTLLATGLIDKKINEQALSEYFQFGSVQAPYSLMEDVFQLLPGHYLIFENSRFTIHKYWEINLESPLSNKTEAEISREIREVLDETVRIHMVSDVTIGALLSGGLDSSVIVGLMSRNSNRKIETFSVVFEEKEYDEREYSRCVAEHFGTEHHEILLKQDDFIAQVPCILNSMDQPSYDLFNSYVISQAIRKSGVKVAFSGLGGDELFGGYPSFTYLPKASKFIKAFKLISESRQHQLFDRIINLVTARKLKKVLFAISRLQSLKSLHSLQRMVFLPDEVKMIMNNKEFLSSRKEPGSNYLDKINLLSYLEITEYMQNTLLQDVDRMSMAHSLEVRVPFLDHIFVEGIFRIPGSLKIGKDYHKRMLVKAVMDILPEKIYERNKKGFLFPFESWFSSSGKKHIEDIMSDKAIRRIEIVNFKAVKRIRDSFLNRKGSYTYPLFLTLLSFVAWYRKEMLSEKIC